MKDTLSNQNNFGRYFEEFEVDEVYNHWPGKTITEYDNQLFSLLTMNHHPVHIDHHYASETQHRQVLVVGTLVFGLVVGQSVRDISGKAIANLQYDLVKHHAPVFIGDTIYSKSTVISKKFSKKTDRGVVEVSTEGFNQNYEQVLTFTRKVLVPFKN